MLVVALLAVAAIKTLPWVWRQLQVDRCLDQGGAWNHSRSTCEQGAPQP